MKKKLFVVMIFFAFIAVSVFANTEEKGVWKTGTTGVIGSAASMTVRLDLSEKRDAQYAVAFTSDTITNYSDEITNIADISLVPNISTMKFNDYGGESVDNPLYISYKFKENTKVALYLEIEGNLKDKAAKASLKYKVSFNNGTVQTLESADSQTSISVKTFEDKAKVGAVEVGSIPLTISAVDTFEYAVTKELSSTMKLIVRSEA